MTVESIRGTEEGVLTSSIAPKDEDSSRDLRSRCTFAVRRPSGTDISGEVKRRVLPGLKVGVSTPRS